MKFADTEQITKKSDKPAAAYFDMGHFKKQIICPGRWCNAPKLCAIYAGHFTENNGPFSVLRSCAGEG
jgi:hypothetical protein